MLEIVEIQKKYGGKCEHPLTKIEVPLKWFIILRNPLGVKGYLDSLEIF